MASKTEIFNLALRRFGQSRVTDAAQQTPAALALNDVWDVARRATLRAHHWSFATKQAELTASAVEPLFEWRFQYPLPVDYLRLVSCNGIPSGTKLTCYDIVSGSAAGSDRGVLVSNQSTAQITYVADVTEWETFDDQYVEALSYKLAELVCPALMADGGQSSVVMAQKGFLATLAAMSSDAIESKPRRVSALQGSAYQAARCLPAPGEDSWLEPGEWGLPATYDVSFNPYNTSP